MVYGCNFKSRKADLILHNAVAITCDGQPLHATPMAIAIVDGRIVATGPERAILNSFRAEKKIDLQHAVIYPGFIDAHAHFTGYALSLLNVDLVGTKSYKEVLDRVVSFSENQGQTNSWITGRGWDENDWASSEYPTLIELDELFPDRPVAIRRIDGHALLANSAALRIAGMTSVRDIKGGEMLSLKDGSPSGVLIDGAADSLLSVIPTPNDSIKSAALIKAQYDLFAVGLTTVVDAGLDVSDIMRIDSLQRTGDLLIRVVAMSSGTSPNLEATFRQGPFRSDRLIAQSIKFYMDGSLGSRGAALLKPYSDRPSHSGFIFQDSSEFLSNLQTAYDLGFQVATHCIGDSAVRNVLGFYNQILDGPNDKRWRIEHAQVVHPSDLPLFTSASILPSVQPTHATSDMYWAGERLGRNRIRHAYAYRDLQDVLGILPLGTDMPIEDIDPRKTFYAATIRKDSKGYPSDGYHLDQSLDRESALYGMTLWSAIANFQEEEVGSIEVGKWADFVILDRNLLTAEPDKLLDAKILRTFVAGVQTYNSTK
ncbi:MAG: amidohydrolase [Bacteroidetes bacterium]|nr:MAG: amidohydrolase [Bacteroidota bacterium]